jgi:hypothetical protein
MKLCKLELSWMPGSLFMKGLLWIDVSAEFIGIM